MTESKLFVVDTSVGTAAGQRTEHSLRCHDVLQAILSICHRVVVCDDWIKEWTQHASTSSSTWEASMRSKGKLLLRGVEGAASSVWQRMEPGIETGGKPVVLKDFFLIELALGADGRILSLDNKTLGHLRRARDLPAEVGSLMWVHPITDTTVLEWLHAGAPDDDVRRILFPPESP